jgi:hypothetical protein
MIRSAGIWRKAEGRSPLSEDPDLSHLRTVPGGTSSGNSSPTATSFSTRSARAAVALLNAPIAPSFLQCLPEGLSSAAYQSPLAASSMSSLEFGTRPRTANQT